MNDRIELKPCPFCGGEAEVLTCDDEGNIHTQEYIDYPWSGLRYALNHEEKDNKGCPIATHEGEIIGAYLYDTEKEAIAAWNRRYAPELPKEESK